MRLRQTEQSQKDLSKKQKKQSIITNKSGISGLNNIPVTSFDLNTQGMGSLGVALLLPRPQLPNLYTENINNLGNVSYDLRDIQTWTYLFIEYNNSNVSGIDGLVKSFAVIKMLNPTSVNDVSSMLGMSYKSISGITKAEYDSGSFNHPTYINDSNQPLSIRYAELPILLQRTPGRLDNIPLGSPDFDSTPDGVTTRVGPIPTPPYTDFVTSTGATSSITIQPGGTVSFKDASVRSPWQFAPTGWVWNFGATASPSVGTNENELVTYSATGSYTVTLTASNASGSTTKTKTNFVIVTY